jgi:hypothetical protein
MLAMLLPMALTAVALGAPLALVGAHFRARIRVFNRRAVATHGAVVGHRVFTATGDTFRRQMTEAHVRFTTRDGRVVDAKGPVRILTEPPQPPLGSTVALLHDPGSDEVSFDGPRGRAGIADALLWIGLVLCGAGLVAAGAHFAVTVGVS